MTWLKSLCIAIGTYSIFPVPQFEWKESNLKYSICFLPVVGLLIGAALFAWAWVSNALLFNRTLFAAVAAVIPLLLTGGIHMDGFMDTTDALSSHRDREQKLTILKDPHIGAFAVIYFGIYLMLSFGLYHALFQPDLLLVVSIGFLLSRSLTVVSVVTLPRARKEGMLHTMTAQAPPKRVLLALSLVALLAAGAMIWVNRASGGTAVAFALITLIAYRCMVKKQFSGVTGDTSGFFLQLSELIILFGVWIGHLF
ncbi:MAG: adenosylcobinamide-GDP ribazoletransferase [Eubacteriales bacterium]